eukprot:scaffold4529_cov121-Cylindrotheca_fusiformis.AAC.5
MHGGQQDKVTSHYMTDCNSRGKGLKKVKKREEEKPSSNATNATSPIKLYLVFTSTDGGLRIIGWKVQGSTTTNGSCQ